MKTSNVLTRLAALFLICLTTAGLSQAHEIKPAIVDLNFTSQVSSTSSITSNDANSANTNIDAGNTHQTNSTNTLTAELVVNLESLIAGIGPTHEDTNDSENSARYEQLRALDTDALITEFELFKSRFLSNISIIDPNDVRVDFSVASIDIPSVGDTALPRDSRITLKADLPDTVVTLQWRWNESFGEVIVRANSDALTMDYATLLSPGQASDFINFTTETRQSAFSVIKNYIVVGFEHILPKGLDHILFVIGLFLLTPKWRPLVLQITTFTVAHSITLALGASNILSMSPSIVEPLIALSIVFVCVENIFLKGLSHWRLAMVFVFGLLHGLGFASVLGEVGLDPSNFLIALLGFNIGVELGQLLVITICLLAVGLWFGQKRWYRKFISIPASVLIGLVGLFWVVERTVL